MRIGISVAPLFTLEGHRKKYDGIGNYTLNLMEALKDKVTFEPTYTKTVRESLKQPFPFFKKQHHFSIISSPFINQYMPIHLYRSYESTIDLYHCTDYKIPKLKNVPVIATLHDAIPFKEAQHANSTSRKLKNYLLKKVASNADYIITISHAMQEDIMQYYQIPSEKISVIYHGINQEWFKHTDDPYFILKKYGIEKAFLLVVGTISPKKNCLRIMQAFAKLPQTLQKDVELIFVGNKGWNCDEEIQLLKQMQLKGNVKWLQYVTQDELKTLYRMSRALIFPSLNEGFGFPIIEAFASQTPVLTSNTGATAEIAGDAGLLVNPHDVDDILQGMQNLILDDSLRIKLMAKGQERANYFSVEEFTRKTLAVYALCA